VFVGAVNRDPNDAVFPLIDTDVLYCLHFDPVSMNLLAFMVGRLFFKYKN